MSYICAAWLTTDGISCLCGYVLTVDISVSLKRTSSTNGIVFNAHNSDVSRSFREDLRIIVYPHDDVFEIFFVTKNSAGGSSVNLSEPS